MIHSQNTHTRIHYDGIASKLNGNGCDRRRERLLGADLGESFALSPIRILFDGACEFANAEKSRCDRPSSTTYWFVFASGSSLRFAFFRGEDNRLEIMGVPKVNYLLWS